jgi:hypothetical protein
MLGLEQNAELGVTELKEMYKEHQENKIPRYQGGSGQACPLSNFLSIHDMLMAVTQEMYYLDIINLSRVSKSIREVVLPAYDIDPCMEVIRKYTCPGEEKTTCWVCDKQVCIVCTTPTYCSHQLISPGLSVPPRDHTNDSFPSPTKLSPVLYAMLPENRRLKAINWSPIDATKDDGSALPIRTHSCPS